MALRISLQYLTAVREQLAITDPPQFMLDDVAGSITFTTVSPDSFMSVTCAQCEPVLICEKNRALMADLPILVFSG